MKQKRNHIFCSRKKLKMFDNQKCVVFLTFILSSNLIHLVGGNFFDEARKDCFFDDLKIGKRPSFRFAGFENSDMTEMGITLGKMIEDICLDICFSSR